MALPTTKTDICNLSLSRIGGKAVTEAEIIGSIHRIDKVKCAGPVGGTVCVDLAVLTTVVEWMRTEILADR